MFKETHPILGTRDIQRAIKFYTQRLGFQLAFRDKTDPPNYVGFRRDAVELHMQFQFEHEMGPSACGFWWRIQTHSLTNIGNVASTAVLTRLTILNGERANSLSTIRIATLLPSTGI